MFSSNGIYSLFRLWYCFRSPLDVECKIWDLVKVKLLHITCRDLSFSQKAFDIEQPASETCFLSEWQVCLWTGTGVNYLKCELFEVSWESERVKQTGREGERERDGVHSDGAVQQEAVSMATAFTSLCSTQRRLYNSGQMYASVHWEMLNPRGSVWSEGALLSWLSWCCVRPLLFWLSFSWAVFLTY